ncbi:MAG: hypothetical protein RL059_771 [Bacteroidota bacterium]|jgi:hypothetical protein
MNKWLISLLVIAAVFLVFQLVVSMTTSDIETPKYKVLKKYPRFELRQYESMMLATTNLGPASYDEKASQGFRTIASYIFGKNKSNEKIAMTAPVIYHADSISTLSFVVPRSKTEESMPVPIDSNLTFVVQAPKLLAVLDFGGFINDEKLAARMAELKKAVLKEGFQIKGKGYFFGYNPPWQLIGRKNEVAFELESVN